jgi:hypothetical protein
MPRQVALRLGRRPTSPSGPAVFLAPFLTFRLGSSPGRVPPGAREAWGEVDQPVRSPARSDHYVQIFLASCPLSCCARRSHRPDASFGMLRYNRTKSCHRRILDRFLTENRPRTSGRHHVSRYRFGISAPATNESRPILQIETGNSWKRPSV